MRRIVFLALCALLQACQASDLTLPSPPTKQPPGTIYGTVVYALPGKMTTAPAANASITILGTGLSTTAGSDGHFLLSGVTQSSGALLIRFDAAMNGMVDHQKLIQLSDIGAGLGRQIDLGEVLVVANATMVGKVLLGDKVDSASGHGGTTVFVPAGPFTTYTNDDGSYSLDELPAGTLTVQFFHSGYDPYELDGISLTAGQNFTASDVVLSPVESPPAPGTISGKITFVPVPSDPTSTVAAAVDSGGMATAGSVKADGTFQITGLAAGVYTVNISHTGYTTSVINNVFVSSGNEVVLPAVTLNAGNGVVDCTPGDSCVPTTPCATGKVDCSTGSIVCMPSGTLPDGTQCGLNEVCKLGVCTQCTANAACMPTTAPCHTGNIVCTTGSPVCVDNGGSAPAGMNCGLNQVCSSGNCVACTSGAECTPSNNPCHVGATDCGTGTSVCVDQATNVMDGTACGAGHVCNAGSCIACDEGAQCTPANACHTGNISCDSGSPVCMDTLNKATDGTVCGVDKVCSNGTCIGCTQGEACTPNGAPCHTGVTQCETGSAVCVDNMGPQPQGTICGTNEVCNSGNCISCQQGLACTPTGNACHTGSMDCSSGSPVCTDTMGVLANGASCGQGKVCSGGSCVSCVAGGVCSPTNAPCHVGAFACDTGVPICIDQQTNVSDGTGCGMNEVCLGGSCTACTANLSCVPTNKCNAGLTSCDTGTSVCIDQNAPAMNGTLCGTGLVCQAGACVPSGFSLIGSAPPAVTVEQSANPFTIRLADQNGAPLVSTMVTCTAPDGGACIPASVATDVNGHASFTAILPRQPGTYSYTVAAAGQGMLAVSVTANAPTAGTIYSLVNQNHSQGNSGVPGPGLLAAQGYLYGLTQDADGTIYFANEYYSQILRLSPNGTLTVVAGTGSAGSGGNGGQATAAQLNAPKGVALDQSHHLLYIADSSNNVIRVVDVSTGQASSGLISLYAGGASGSPANEGDGLTALAATFNYPIDLALGPDDALYVTETNNGRIRRIDPVSHVINSWVVANPQTCPASGVQLYDCYDPSTDNGCRVAWSPSGTAYVSGRIFGPDSGSCNPVEGVVRINADGSLTQVAGYYNGQTADGEAANGSALPGLPILAFDSSGNLFLSFPNASVIKRVDGATGILTTVAGNGTQGFSGLFVPSTQSVLSQPEGILIDGNQNIVFADASNFSIRTIAAPPVTTPLTVTLTPVTGTQTQTATVDQAPPQSLAVTLADSAGPVPGAQIRWAAVTPGGWISQSQSITSSTGIASVQVRAGRAPQMYQFSATFTAPGGATTSTMFTVTATAASSGTIYSLVNLSHTQGNTSVPFAGVMASTGQPQDLTTTSDGTLYFSDSYYCVVRKLSPSGLLTTVAGNASCSNSTAPGSAVGLPMGHPFGVAVNESTQTLYIADNQYNVIRAVDLVHGTISIVAGGGSAGGPGYGDGGPAAGAVFSSVTHLAIGPDGLLYVSDLGQNRVRTINLASPSLTINGVPGLTGNTNQPSCGSQAAAYLYDCYGSSGACTVAWDQAQNVYISGRVAGQSISGCNVVPGVLRISHADGSVSLVAGAYNGQTSQGFSAVVTNIPIAPFIAIDSSADLYLSYPGSYSGESFLQRIDAFSGVISNVAGTSGTPGYAGDLVPATGALLNSPLGITFDPAGNLIIADQGNYAVRTIATPPATTTDTVTLTAQTGTQMQTAIVDQPPPLLLSAVLANSAGPLVDFPIQWASLTEGGWISASTVPTNASGVSAIQVRAGRQAGTTYQFSATFTNIQGQKTTQVFSVVATAATTGDIYTLVNLAHAQGNAFSGPGVETETGGPQDLAVASDGTLYISDWSYCVVRMLSPKGQMTTIAGNSSCGNTPGATPVQTSIGHPAGLALDENTNTLYIADNQYGLIRALDLTHNTLSVFAGGGSAPAPGYGDGGAASNAVFRNLTRLAIGPDGFLYISDTSVGRIRTIDLSNPTYPITSPAILSSNTACTSNPVQIYDCYYADSCNVAWDSEQNLYISARLIGSAIPGCNVIPGVMRVSHTDGSVSLVAGAYNGQTSPGFAAVATSFPQSPFIAIDGADNIYLSFPNSYSGPTINQIERIDASSGKLTTIAGGPSVGYAGDLVPSAGSQVNNPQGLVVDPGGNLIFADYSNYAVRTIAGEGTIAGSGAKLVYVSGNNQTTAIDALAPAPFIVKLVDGSGSPLVGYPIQWTALTPGSGFSSATSQYYTVSATTDANGQSSVQGRAGLIPTGSGTANQFTASYSLGSQPVTGSPVTFSMTATAPSSGTIFTVANVIHSNGNTSVPAPAPFAGLGAVRGMTVSPKDGSIYFADYGNCAVRRMTLAGDLATVAGNNGCGYTGDLGLATSAQLNHPTGLAIDPTGSTLYISDTNNNVVRAVNLTTGIISTFSGEGSEPAPYGDSGPPLSANLYQPTHLAFGPDGHLYITDVGHERIRYVDFTSNTINTLIATTGNGSSSLPVSLFYCNAYTGSAISDCQVAWDSAGNAYVTGLLSGTLVGSGYTPGIIEIAGSVPSGAQSYVAGHYGGVTTNGALATATVFTTVPTIAFDSTGNLYTVDSGAQVIRKISGGTINTIAGNGTGGYLGDYVAATGAEFSSPWMALPLANGHLLISDTGNYALREIW